MRTETMTWEEFEQEFKPTQNTISNRDEFNGWLFETYGDDVLHIGKLRTTMPNNVWTIVTADAGHLVIINGWHYVNRYGYVVTEKAFNDGDQITVEDEDDKEYEQQEEERINKLARPTEY